MSSSQSVAKRPGHWLVTAWPTSSHRADGGFAIRFSASCLSADGSLIRISDSNGRTFEYPPLLTSSISITRALDTQPAQANISGMWKLPTGVTPIDMIEDFLNERGVAEVAWVDENSSGTGTEQTWEQRNLEVGMLGKVVGFSYGRKDQALSFTITEESDEDMGSIYPSGSQISSLTFPNVGNTGDNDRAKYSIGLWPPIPIGPNNGSYSLQSPLLCVADVVDANSGTVTAITYARYLAVAAGESLYDTTTDRDVLLVDPRSEQPGKVIADGSTYTGIPQIGTDAVGLPYTYMEGSWIETFATASIHTVSGSDAVTGEKFLRLSEQDQFRVSLNGTHDWVRIEEITDGGHMTLVSNYAHNNTNQNGQVIRLAAAMAMPAYLYISSFGGGIVGPWAEGPMSNPIEVMEWLLRKSRLNIDIDFAGLRAMATKFSSWNVAHVIYVTQNEKPLEYMREHFMPWLPIREYMVGGQLRFLYDGPVDPGEACITIDLDDENQGIVRTTGISELQQPVYNRVELTYGLNIRRGVFEKTLTVDASASTATTRVTGHSRAMTSQYSLEPPVYSAPVSNTLAMVIDSIADDITAGLVASSLLYRYSQRPRVMTLYGTPRWRWLQIGDIIEVNEAQTMPGNQLWRVRARTHGPDGEVQLGLESVVF